MALWEFFIGDPIPPAPPAPWLRLKEGAPPPPPTSQGRGPSREMLDKGPGAHCRVVWAHAYRSGNGLRGPSCGRNHSIILRCNPFLPPSEWRHPGSPVMP